VAIGKIVLSQSQCEYTCRVYGPGESSQTPSPADYALGNFVCIQGEGEQRLVGLISNTRLINPAFGNLGPRLSPEEDLAIFAPDYLAERATVIDILAIGSWDVQGAPLQGVPRCVAQADALVTIMDDEAVRGFHASGAEGLTVSYLPNLLSGGLPLALPLTRQVLATLERLFPQQAQRLAVLAQHLAWNAQIETLR